MRKTYGEKPHVERNYEERTYEVIRFVRSQNRCHPAMDCVSGQLLIYHVQQCPEMEKGELFEWVQKLAEQLELYHLCKNDQPYRFFNPYSVLVTRDGDVALLDLEAQSNEFVLRNMQKQAMRNHFVRPIVHIKENKRQFLDLYGYGKTVQFILANVKARPALTRGEERRLARVVEKCTSENPKRQFEELGQVKKELPVAGGQDLSIWKKRIFHMAAPALLLLLSVVLGARMKVAEDGRKSTVKWLQVQTEENETLRESNERLQAENQALLEENQAFQVEKQEAQEEKLKLQEEAQKLREEAQGLREENQRLQEGETTVGEAQDSQEGDATVWEAQDSQEGDATVGEAQDSQEGDMVVGETQTP